MYKLETEEHSFLKSGKSPMGIQFHAKKNLLFVSNWFENKISVVDIKKNAIKSQIPVGNSPAGIFLSKSGNLFVAIKEENLVSVIDISTQKKN